VPRASALPPARPLTRPAGTAHYQAFAQALPQHSTLFSHMELSQTQVQAARTALLDAKEALGNKRADLVQIWARGQSIEEMIRILDQMCA
jgi:exocyst complex component 4